ncbi:MAG: cytochrome bd-I oxidase subunit CydX [Gammaproteobacteria bacterium]|nr:cytochrome bd-I oxidase subunit CydX [Gammaproteobacteria bacterium]
MWYFAWILGTAFACSFAILHGLWYELHHEGDEE